MSVSERLCRNHFWHPVEGSDLQAGLTCPGLSAVLSVSRVHKDRPASSEGCHVDTTNEP